MRLHRLTVTAFGPFAGTEQLDFDELNEAGLFLLTGPTGAGKSSLLDAVCFALYGTVPGVRGVKALKSQHAPGAAKPEVVLDFSVQGRRFVVRRTPEWVRPKQRGTGLVTERACASILETTGGGERLLSARAAEVGLQVSDLMGMTAGQFVQVALLPQGEFQTFLRASSQERHDVLQQLFGTDRFTRIEDWVGDHSRRLKEEAAIGRSTVQRILDTVADRVGSTTPEDLAGEELAAAAAQGRVRSWVAAVRGGAETELRCARDELRRTREQLARTRERHQQAIRRNERGSRLEAAREALRALEQSAPAAEEQRAMLAGHERATRCGPVLELHTQALAAHRKASAARDEAVHTLTVTALGAGVVIPAHLTASSVSALADDVRARVARLEALLPREEAAQHARRERDRQLAGLRRAEQDLAEATLLAERLPADIERHTAELASAAALSAGLEAVSTALTAARARYDAAVLLPEVEQRLAALRYSRRDARDLMQDARAHLQALVGRRLAGMAAELAGSLAEGAACQVCGSIDHPRPATPDADAVTDLDHRLADDRLVEAARALDSVEQEIREVHRRRDHLAVVCAGLAPEQAADQVTERGNELAEAIRAQARCGQLHDRLRTLRAEHHSLGARQTEASATAAALQEVVATHERTLATVSTEIEEALAQCAGSPSVREAVTMLSGCCGVLEETRLAVVGLDAATTRLVDLTARASAAAAGHGFSRLADVDASLLAEPVRERLDRQLRDRVAAEARVRAVLEDPDLADAEAEDLTELGVQLETAESAASHAARVHALHEDRVAALALLVDRLGSAMDTWAPVRDESLRAEAISRLVRGMGHDNLLQMRLSSYVLATRLDQVVAAANERLGHMRDQRYLLQRTGQAERRSAQAGLGLEIVDQWTGDVRSPSTLSGGETFVVSLSLALGLADVVTQESGGTEVETLFVDEGFGTLDADTLDDVMDRLDGLRAGGRTVGVVSHVTELRSRIPTQVQVDKGRAGSTVVVRTLVG